MNLPRWLALALGCLLMASLGWWLRGCREPAPVRIVLPGRVDQGAPIVPPDSAPPVPASGPVLAENLTPGELSEAARAAGLPVRPSEAPGSPRSDEGSDAAGPSSETSIATEPLAGEAAPGEISPFVTDRLRRELICQAGLDLAGECPKGSPAAVVSAWRLSDGTVDLTAEWRPLELEVAPAAPKRWDRFIGVGAIGSCPTIDGARVCDVEPAGVAGLTWRPFANGSRRVNLAIPVYAGLGPKLEPVVLAGVGVSW